MKFSLDRVRYIKFQSSQYLKNVTSVNVVDDETIDIMLKNRRAAARYAGGADSRHRAQGRRGARRRRHRGIEDKDKATEWLNQNSAGTGPYR